ncbi:glycoside hydrolase N-terminal domain-containing protein [Streptacidiphilus sp. P02-A3a]|uniref:glycoside hydrolase family 95 protein n=1 Tax=Streptacidiphilus sp. P02-A3a TaxID=2704468 RepID=UPI0015F99943|nr:glycoside hydrolase family 95 protein [Streptacidiphilus sp. P02-A3a]QMU69813.1 glycoside hydrolase family 95 protein [Streptacidiphilus sp. P02-A3a]
MNSDLLWYRAPAAGFLEALPLGNGRLGAMVYGQPVTETIALNEDTLWAGGPGDRNDHTAAEQLAPLRQALLRDADHARAERLARAMQGPDTQPYQPLGTLRLSHRLPAPARDYRRSLDLRTATSTVRFGSGGAEQTRTSFVSAPAGVLVHRISAAPGGRVDFTARLSTPHPALHDGELTLGRAPAQVTDAGPEYRGDAGTGFGIGLRVLAEGGSVRTDADGGVTVTGAVGATVLVAAATGYRGWDSEPTGPDPALRARITAVLDAAADRSFAELHAEHTADHARLYARAGLRLGPPDGDREQPPTDERLAALRAGADDPGLAALHFNYGRYLLIACSRPGSQPANLQGIWNLDRRPPWNCDWTTNINTQMNYWPAESTGLAECHSPLFDLIADLAQAGQRTARAYYRCAGWTAHHNVDLWRGGNPVGGGPQWANWPMAGAWLCAHLWQHYRYGGDREFLAERGYPAMRGAALFLLDFLVEQPDGSLVTCPSTSPEHRFVAPDGTLAAVTAQTAMDYWLTDELFDSCARAARILGVDRELAVRLDAARARLRRPRLGADGALLEWWEPLTDEDPGHRHLSHLYGLYPGERITADRTPELFAAARLALDSRLRHGGGGTGWSLAWVTALAARLGDGELAHRALLRLLDGSTAPNLFDLHPPEIFQIDGNLGATAAIAELLLRNDPQALRLLPALPRAWDHGAAHGLRAHGGLTVDLRWQRHRLEQAALRATHARTVTVTVPTGGRPTRVTDPDGDPVPAQHRVTADGACTSSFAARPGAEYLLQPG